MAQCLKCLKCSLDLSRDTGYVKCLGCVGRYHYGQCSGISQNTWKAKGQQSRDDWRCEPCRKKLKESDTGSKSESVSETNITSGESTVLLKSIQESLQSFSDEHELKNSALLEKFEYNVQKHFETMNKNMEALVQSLVTKIDVLANSLVSMESNQKLLVEDNSQLKKNLNTAYQKIVSLERKMSGIGNQQIHHNDNVATVISPSVSNAASSQRQYNDVTRTRTLASTSLPAATSTHVHQTVTGPTADHGSTSGRDDRARGNVDSAADWQTVSYQRPRKARPAGPAPKIGTKSVSQAGAASSPMVRAPRVRTSALFISRFSPNITVGDIKGLLTSLSLSHLVVSKIKTRYRELYSSFHVEVLESDFVKIDDETVWPDGCLIKPFQGRLKADTVVSDVPPTDNTSTTNSGGNTLSDPTDGTHPHVPPLTSSSIAPILST